jgi:hypothetical protein
VSQGSSGGTTGRKDERCRSILEKSGSVSLYEKKLLKETQPTYCVVSYVDTVDLSHKCSPCVGLHLSHRAVVVRCREYWGDMMKITASIKLPNRLTSSRKMHHAQYHTTNLSIRQPSPPATLASSGYGDLPS